MEELVKKINEDKSFIYNDCVDLVLKFLSKHTLSSNKDVEYFIYYWLPKNLKYSTECDIYRLGTFIEAICKEFISDNLIKEFSEIARIYTVKNNLFKITKNPILNGNKKIIYFDNYVYSKNNKKNKDIATTYEKLFVIVKEVNEGGCIITKSLVNNKEYKLLLEYPSYKNIQVGDIFHITMKRKLFYVYWEIDKLHGVYPSNSEQYIKAPL